MKTSAVSKQFTVTLDGKKISSGGIGLLVSDETPPRTWVKDFQMTNDLDSFELLSNESDAVVSAVIAGKTELPIRDSSIVLHIQIADTEMDLNEALAQTDFTKGSGHVQRIPDNLR